MADIITNQNKKTKQKNMCASGFLTDHLFFTHDINIFVNEKRMHPKTTTISRIFVWDMKPKTHISYRVFNIF
jgi:hypothetical protein